MISYGMEGVFKPLSQWGKAKCQGRTHKAVNYSFCLLCPIIYFCQKLVEEVISLGWERYGGQIRIGKTTHFENVFLTSWESKCLEMHAHPIIHPHLSFLSHSHSRLALSRS